MSEQQKRRSVGDIIVERFLKDVDETGVMPWQRPYNCYSAFNWYTKTPYRGINRLILPFGEYLTLNQIKEYNKKHGTNYRCLKGSPWEMVVFFKRDVKDVTRAEFEEKFPDQDYFEFINTNGYASDGYWMYYGTTTGSIKKVHNIMRYTNVLERQYWLDDDGNCLPSRIETGEVQIVRFDAKDIFDSYINRTGVKVDYDSSGIPCYIPMLDKIELNRFTEKEEEYWSTAFHEGIHSTGCKKRLARNFFIKNGLVSDGKEDVSIRAEEECIAEIGASLLCAECNIHDFSTSESSAYKNNIAYVQNWKKRITDWGKKFVYIASEAEKAYNYFMGFDYEE